MNNNNNQNKVNPMEAFSRQWFESHRGSASQHTWGVAGSQKLLHQQAKGLLHPELLKSG